MTAAALTAGDAADALTAGDAADALTAAALTSVVRRTEGDADGQGGI